jgi:hypothetical protein
MIWSGGEFLLMGTKLSILCLHLWTWQVIVPLEKVREVLSVPNAKKPTEKYIQVVTKDGHEFWYMGFVNYDKGLKNMQEAVRFAQSQNNLSGGSMPGGAAPYAPPPPMAAAASSSSSTPLYPPPASDRPGYSSAAPPLGYPSAANPPPPLGYPPAMKPGYGPPAASY